MRYIFLSLLVMLFITGCGYKGDPKYDNGMKQQVKS